MSPGSTQVFMLCVDCVGDTQTNTNENSFNSVPSAAPHKGCPDPASETHSDVLFVPESFPY